MTNIVLTIEDIENLANENHVSIKETSLLVAHILQKSYTEVFFSKKINFSVKQYDVLKDFLKRRKNKEPISKILQKKEFYGAEYTTNSYTLDPRPETELIVDLFQKYFPDKKQKLDILDLGCGTGCIGLSILDLYKNSNVEFVDIDENTLQVCIDNSKEKNLFSRSKFTLSNWFSEINNQFDVIVSNPPYICEHYNLDKEVLYDPKIALFAGQNGLDAYKKIVPNLGKYLKHDGIAILEIGYDQKDSVLNLNTHPLKVLEVAKDLNDIDRTIVFTF